MPFLAGTPALTRASFTLEMLQKPQAWLCLWDPSFSPSSTVSGCSRVRVEASAPANLKELWQRWGAGGDPGPSHSGSAANRLLSPLCLLPLFLHPA